MKKFLRWLSDISGVTNEIRTEERKYIANTLIQNAHWFSGGLVYNHPLENISNFAVLYGEELKESGFVSISELRDILYKMNQQNLSVYENREVYGYWSDNIYPNFIKKEDYKGEKDYIPKLRIKFK